MNDITIEVIGIPWDEKSSFLKGCSEAPDKIWSAFCSDSANKFCEDGSHLGIGEHFYYHGSLELREPHQVIEQLIELADQKASGNVYPLFLGGDHAITYPLVKGIAARYKNLNILHFDAHPDLYEQLRGDRYSHACPFARIMEERLVKRMVSVGIRTMTRHQKEQAERFGVEVIDMRSFDSHEILSFDGPLYLSLDLDVLDPAYAPGISHYEPGGMTTRELIRVIQQMRADLVAADIVEYNPQRDFQGMTAMTAAKLMKEIAARFKARSGVTKRQ